MSYDEVQTNFAAGQLGRESRGRTDAEAYGSAAIELTNVEPLLQGGVRRRPGTTFVMDLGEATRAEALRFGAPVFVLLFAAGRLRVLDAEGVILHDFAAPWDAGAVWELNWDQAGRLVFITHFSHAPRVLRRLEDGTFDFSAFTFLETGNIVRQPHYRYINRNVTLSLSKWALGETTVVTASEANAVTAAQIGDRIRVRSGELRVTAIDGPTQFQAVVERRVIQMLDPAPVSVSNASSIVTVTAYQHGLKVGDVVRLRGLTALGGLDASDLNRDRTVTAVPNPSTFRVDCGTPATRDDEGGGADGWIAAEGVATREWSEPMWSDRRGWPGAVAVHGGRLWFGGPRGLGEAFVGSRPGDFEDFDVGDGSAADAVMALGTSGGNVTRHLVSADDLVILGARSEAYMPTEERATTQTEARTRRIDRNGAASVAPLMIDGAVFWIDYTRRHLRELRFVSTSGGTGFAVTAVSAFAPELLTGVSHMAFYEGQRRTSSGYALLCNDTGQRDGDVAVFWSRGGGREARGWARWTTKGSFRSFAAADARLWAVAEREHFGETRWILERVDFDAAAESDCGHRLVAAGGPTRDWTLPRFAGLTVDVHDADGAFVGRARVAADGSFRTPVALSEIVAGHRFVTRISPMPPAIVPMSGSKVGKVLRVVRMRALVSGRGRVRFDDAEGDSWITDAPSDPGTRGLRWEEATIVGSFREPEITLSPDVPEGLTVLAIGWDVVVET